MSRPVTFVHAADLHLDAPFQGVDAAEERVRSALVESTYRALDVIVETCLARSVDFLVLAGDVFNSADRSVRAQRRFRAAMDRLADAGVPVFVAQGNHDPAGGWSAGIEMPAAVRYFPTDRVGRFEVADPQDPEGAPLAVLYGQGYASRAVTENLAAGYRRDPSDAVAIGVLHANVGGQAGYEPYAPCTLEDLRAARMDYWALGHIHKPLELSADPPVRYAGSPQGLNPKEDGPHGCLVVTIDRGQVGVEVVETSQVRWAHREVDARDLATLDDVATAVTRACASARAEAAGVPVVLRVELTGRSPVHALLARAGALDDLAADLREAQLAETPWVWIDRIRDVTRSEIDLESVRTSGDFAGDLVRQADEVEADAAALDEFVSGALSGLSAAVDLGDLDRTDILERARDAALDLLLVEEDR